MAANPGGHYFECVHAAAEQSASTNRPRRDDYLGGVVDARRDVSGDRESIVLGGAVCVSNGAGGMRGVSRRSQLEQSAAMAQRDVVARSDADAR